MVLLTSNFQKHNLISLSSCSRYKCSAHLLFLLPAHPHPNYSVLVLHLGRCSACCGFFCRWWWGDEAGGLGRSRFGLTVFRKLFHPAHSTPCLELLTIILRVIRINTSIYRVLVIWQVLHAFYKLTHPNLSTNFILQVRK